MDRVKAAMLESALIGRALDGWKIERLIDCGKSAAVFVGHKGGQIAAVKVFDTDLIERYGDQAQLDRINRELELRGCKHDHLVAIYGGGFDPELNLHFIIMEFLDGPNLKTYLPRVTIEQIETFVHQLASAAQYLEGLGLVHRDIKPENIAIIDGGRRLVLLDFGVIRPISGSDLTDPDGIHAFIGTLQYSSPEFLLREEAQDIDGWRALTFYQIGAVMHDLITGRPIFEQFANPYARLVNAVQFEKPTLVNPDVSGHLIQLAERCLLKNASTRLRLVRWQDFAPREDGSGVSARDRVAERMVTLRAQTGDLRGDASKPTVLRKRISQNVLSSLKLAATAARSSIPGLPPLRQSKCDHLDSCVELVFEPSEEHGFPHGLIVRVLVEVVDPTENVVSCTGYAFFPKSGRGDEWASIVSRAWFEGVLDNVALHAAFDQFFFEATEWCLQVSPGVDGDFDGVFGREPDAGVIDG